MKKSKEKIDLTGRSRLTHNVIIGWLGQLVFIVSGFILPRMINGHLGQDILGVWDFCWSLITYFEFIYSGLISSVNRYVAKHRATNDTKGVNTAVSSVFFLLLALSFLIVLLSGGVAVLLPDFMQAKLGNLIIDAQWVIFFLGLDLAGKICFAIFGGILTGCHRWDLQYGINAANRLATLLGMVVVLLNGGGLPQLALVYLCIDTLVLSSRCLIVFRVCPTLEIKPHLFRRATAANMWRFGMKTLLPDLGNLMSNQTFNLLLVWFLGPAALAVFARPRALVRHIQTLARRYCFTLTPTASSLQTTSSTREIHDFTMQSCRAGSFIVFPMVWVLTIVGGAILDIWMGNEYADNILPTVLVLGYLPVLLQLPLNSILQGFNYHGWPGLFKFVASISGIGAAFTVLYTFNTNVTGAAIALFLPFLASELIATPIYAAKRLNFSLWEYWLVCIFQPGIVTIPMFICLLVFRLVYPTNPELIVFIGIPCSFFCFTVSFWFYGASNKLRDKVVSRYKRMPLFLKSLSKMPW